ncbi:hypothetical protein [Bradyrhizobium archetypum]|uniref:Uncharacterized protein n=1 Tax=Bradyrhizobium archetypum TaxID=2721160 RepID=A0A7Y4GZV3_9BRAD|nr:hypothetical protein [Bradyrhizobium archetypum]NOJ44764.1 hypothetical protein [Bradyrhizobium archetypum]
MALGTDELIEIERVLAAAEPDATSFSELRRRFPQLAVTRCDASDVTEQPFRSFPHFDLHLIDGCDRCVQITTDPARAIGILLATRSTGP